MIFLDIHNSELRGSALPEFTYSGNTGIKTNSYSLTFWLLGQCCFVCGILFSIHYYYNVCLYNGHSNTDNKNISMWRDKKIQKFALSYATCLFLKKSIKMVTSIICHLDLERFSKFVENVKDYPNLKNGNI